MASRLLLGELGAIVGQEGLWTDTTRMKPYQSDHKTGFWGNPSAVCFPQTTEHVQAIVQQCIRYGVPMVPRGAGTGRSGGAVPPDGGVVISTEKMVQTRELNRESLFVEVESGRILQSLQQEVEEVGLFYPPDPASLAVCTLGGNVAENAGGPRAFKYGVTRDYVLGVEVVLPDGSLVQCGTRTRKGVVGYDMTGLMVGSEGTLGIMTSILFRLLPKPAQQKTLLALFSCVEDAALAVNQMVEAAVIPACIELMDRHALAAAKEHAPYPIDEKVKAALIIEVDGDAATLEEQIHRLPSLLEPARPLELIAARDLEEQEQLWAIRRRLSESLRERYRFKMSEDIVVPKGKLPELTRKVEEIAKPLPIDIAQYGHAGDGNLHVNFLWNEPEHRMIAHEAIETLFRVVLKLKGTISGEHGIGLCKRPYLPWEQSKGLIRIQEQIKSAIDPKHLMNPGKIFPVPEGFPRPIFHQDDEVTIQLYPEEK